jgi:hypothetical protein
MVLNMQSTIQADSCENVASFSLMTLS